MRTSFLIVFCLIVVTHSAEANQQAPLSGDGHDGRTSTAQFFCVDRLRLGRDRAYTEDARLYRERSMTASVDGGTPSRVTSRAGVRLELAHGEQGSKHRWSIAYVDGKVYETDQFHVETGGLCLYYRPRYGHFELTDLAHAHENQRCLDCRADAPTTP